jgi:micrococcal nuclease
MPRRLLAAVLLAGLAALGVQLSAGGRESAPGSGSGSGERVDGPARVVRVIDGDTIKVRVGGRRETVRLIGIDTPESHRPGTPVECGARAATRALQRLAVTSDGRGRSVTLVSDPGHDDRDRYGRVLAYADLAGGRDLGEAQVRSGWAKPYVYGDVPFVRLGRYRQAAREARDTGRGVWAACGGDGHRPAG